jgi:capsular exopolysaccharide synthesis family protein
LDFTSVARAIRRHWLVAFAAFLLVLAVGLAFAYLPSDKYSATAVVLVQPDPAKQVQPQVVSLITPTLVAELGSRTLRDAALQSISDPYRKASVQVKATDDGTGVLRIVASSSNRDAVAPWATAFASQVVQSTTGDGYVTISLLDTATKPTAPYAPNRQTILASFFLMGLIVGVMSALAAAAYRRRLEEANEIRSRFGTPVLAEIPSVRGVERSLENLTGPNAPPEVIEAIQSLRTNVEFQIAGRTRRSVAVVSAASGEGKSTVACVLASALAAAGSETTLVDADLRRPMVHRYLGLRLAPGLTSIAQRPLSSLLQATRQPKLTFLAAGVADRHPAEILPLTVPPVLHQLSDRTVVVDCPPFDGFAETGYLTSMVESVVLVVDWRRRDLVDVERSLDALNQRGAEVLGVVINRSRRKTPASKYYYDQTAAAPRQSESAIRRLGAER